jgi:hypothetical protein
VRCQTSNTHIRRATALTALAVLAAMLASITVSSAYDHRKLPNRLRVEPKVGMDLGIAARGQLPIYIRTRNAEIGKTDGFGVKIWVDTVKIFNDDHVDGTDVTISLDLRKLGPGYHYILTNVCDHNDHVGASSMWIQITKDMRVVRYSDVPPKVARLWRNGQKHWPGKLRTVSEPIDTMTNDVALECCGDNNPWPLGASDRDFFYMMLY